MNRSLKVVSVLASLSMYLVLLMGALVTNTGSGKGCGASWPLCNGSFLPNLDYHTIIEYSHRAVTGAAGILVVALAAWAWFALRQNRMVKWLAATALVTLVLQSFLGAAAALWPQPKAVLALHFGISLVCFGAVLLLAVLVFGADRPQAHAPTDPLLQRWVWWVTLFSYLVVYLGAYVRHLGASFACMGWPLCNGRLIPHFDAAVGASFIHRVAAALLAILVLRMALMARRLAARPDLVRGAYAALALIVAQSASGALFPLGYLNIATQMLHSAIITGYWGVMAYLSLQVISPRSAALAKASHQHIPAR